MKKKDIEKLEKSELVTKVLEQDVIIQEKADRITEVEKFAADLQDVINKCDANHSRLEQEVKDQDGLIKELHEALANAATPATPSNIIVHQGIQYRITSPSFMNKGRKYSADHLKTLPALCDELIEKGSGVLKRI